MKHMPANEGLSPVLDAFHAHAACGGFGGVFCRHGRAALERGCDSRPKLVVAVFRHESAACLKGGCERSPELVVALIVRRDVLHVKYEMLSTAPSCGRRSAAYVCVGLARFTSTSRRLAGRG